MASNRSDEFDLVVSKTTHEWVRVDELVESLVANIPPGKAKREYQDRLERGRQYRLNQKRQAGDDNPTIDTSLSRTLVNEDRQIESGAKSLLRTAIHSAAATGKLLVEERDGVRLCRRNVFTAEEIDELLARVRKVSHTPLPPPPPPVQPDRTFEFLPLMFDHKSVKHTHKIQANLDTNVVQCIIEVDEQHDLVVNYSPLAADWVSDQFGMQTLRIRGHANPQKIITHQR